MFQHLQTYLLLVNPAAIIRVPKFACPPNSLLAGLTDTSLALLLASLHTAARGIFPKCKLDFSSSWTKPLQWLFATLK